MNKLMAAQLLTDRFDGGRVHASQRAAGDRFGYGLANEGDVRFGGQRKVFDLAAAPSPPERERDISFIPTPAPLADVFVRGMTEQSVPETSHGGSIAGLRVSA